ncbi:MAG: MG2 domain-containing protein [Saprospiraceae bacterium]
MKKSILFFLAVFTIFACKPSQQNIEKRTLEIDEAFGAYLSEHTQSNISVSQNLIFRFSGPIIAQEKVGENVDNNIIKISPDIKGRAYWKDSRTITFVPANKLPYDTHFDVQIKLENLFEDVPQNLRKVNIPFSTQPLDFNINIDNINYENIEDDLLVVSGWINSSDIVDDKQVEAILSAHQKNNSKINILWTHSQHRHHFEILNVQRNKESSKIMIEWNDHSSTSKFKGSKTINIFGRGIYKTIQAKTQSGNNKVIDISFSNPIERTQLLDGLIHIETYKGKIKYDILGSQIKVYLQNNVKSPFTIIVEKGIKNNKGENLRAKYTKELSFDPIKPEVRLTGEGVIVPHNDEIIFPFEAINLKGATIEIFKIFDDNVLQFLQYNRLGASYGLESVGRIVHQQHINLTELNTEINDAKFVRYALDLNKIISPDPGSIYQVRIGFKKADVINYSCKDNKTDIQPLAIRDEIISITTNPRYEGYEWSHRTNPCKQGYYNKSKVIKRNVLASNIGIISKRSKNNNVNLILSDLRTIEPLVGAEIAYYDYQQQLITKTSTGSKGMSNTTLKRKPSFVIIKHNGDFGYLNMQDQHANSLSEFEVSGKSKNKGLDGFIYGERGVWRPGDTIFLNFVLEDKNAKLPAKHPIKIKITDARGKQKYTETTTTHIGYVYNFKIPTSPKDPTGNWSAQISVGGAKFRKTLKVETVKPNRLKIKYDLNEDASLALHKNQSIQLISKWLHGAPANGLKAKVDMQISPIKTNFKGYSKYIFDDPARKIDPQPITIFDDKLSAQGNANIEILENKKWLAPGKLIANFKTKVFEKGGNFSEDNFSVKADLYSSYVGIKIPNSRWGGKFIKNNTPTDIPIIVLDANGKPIANRQLSVGLYRAEWNWWYANSYNDKYNYNTATHNGAVKKSTLVTNSKGEAVHNLEFEKYGNYMIRVCDEVTGHCTGDLFYTGYSWSSRGKQDGPQMLSFTTDKKSYNVGENITVNIPSNKGSKILISIENGQKVLQSYWVDGMVNETRINIPTDIEMNSNIYIHAHLIQQHNNGENDLPIRMYGIVPVSVISKASQIKPILDMPESLRPNEIFEVNISEENGKPMSYTIAVVDEGLLDLTRYKTPDLWNHFYAKQALGVKTWDIYNMVLNSYGGNIDRLISIGGDAALGSNKKNKKANRFVPVIRHLGPFHLAAGEHQSHKISMPNYIGSVRTMIVARNNEAYGKTDKTTPVKKPLMILATVPRVLGPGEQLALPTNIFAMKNSIKDVNVSVETSSNISIIGENNQSLHFDNIGDQQSYFDMKVGNQMGQAKIKVSAKGNGEGAYEEVNITIRNPNPYTSKVFEATIEPGEKWSIKYELFGTNGTNEGVLELSNIPPMNFGKRLKYLIRYPYGCVEQTTSSVFPQLYLSEIAELDEKETFKTENNIKRGIERLSLFQLSNGGFSYWPGNTKANEWGTNYAGHFLLEAKTKGYLIPDGIIKEFIKYQDNKATSYTLPDSGNEKNRYKFSTQAYRLYTLALAGSPNIGAMNRMRSKKNLTSASSHMLAAAYALIGKKKIAQDLVSNSNLNVKPYIETGNTYGSEIRDLAMMAEAQQIIGNKAETAQLIKTISREMASKRWYSTQTTAYALLSVGKFMAVYQKDDLKYEYTVNSLPTVKGNTSKPTIQKSINVEQNDKSIKVKNTSTTIMYVRFVLSGQLPPGSEENAYSKHLSLEVDYRDTDGKPIDHTKIKQGTDFIAIVNVTNIGSRGYKIDEVALSQIFPSGWEIQNSRMSSIKNTQKNSPFEYRDFRDDRVYTFFDIHNKKKLTYTVSLNATYAGKFYLSPTYVEAMYDNEIQAKTKGEWVEVVK